MASYPIVADFRTTAAPQAVWDAFAGVERWPLVLPTVGNARIEPPGIFEAGALLRILTGPESAPVVQFYRVAEAEPPRRLVLESDTESWRGRTEYDIAPDGTGTHLIVRSTMEVLSPLLRVQMFVVGRTLNKQRETALHERTKAMLKLAEGV